MKDNKKLLSEEKYQENNAKVKKIAKILLIIGIIILVIGTLLMIIGFMNAGNNISNEFNEFGENAFNNINSMDEDATISGFQDTFNNATNTTKGIFNGFGLGALGMFLDFIGSSLVLVGGVMMFIAHRREITAYTTQQVMPVAQEGIEKITPTVANAAGSIAQSVSKGIQEGKNEAKNK